MKAIGTARFVLWALVPLLAACESTTHLEPCNIAVESCQEDIYYALVRMRGDGYDPLAGLPPINTIPVEEYERQLRAAAAAAREREELQEPDPEPDPDAPEPVVPWDFALQTLRLVTPTEKPDDAEVEERVNVVAAFYSSASRSVTVIDRGQERNDFGDTALLLHELTHALQDREVSGSFDDGTTDGDLAARALTEGEAMFYQNIAQLEMSELNPVENDWHAGYTTDLRNGRANLVAHTAKCTADPKVACPSPFYSVRWYIYPLGARYLSDAWERGGNAGVRHAYVTQPTHIGQFMTPHDEPHAGVRAVLDPALACRVTPPSASWQRLGPDRFGALIVYAFLTAAKLPDEEAWPLAAGWDDDLIYVFFEPEAQQVLVSWRIRLADEDAAERALDLIQLDPRVRASAEGRDLVLITGNDEDVTDDWDGTLVCD